MPRFRDTDSSTQHARHVVCRWWVSRQTGALGRIESGLYLIAQLSPECLRILDRDQGRMCQACGTPLFLRMPDQCLSQFAAAGTGMDS